MESSKLHEDLLKEFQEEKELINGQLILLEPLAVSLRKPIAARVLNKIVILTFEILTWLGILMSIAFCFLSNKIYPFFILSRMRNHAAALGFSDRDMANLQNSIYVFAIIIAFLLFIIARNLAKLRSKNSILQMAGKTIKTVVGEHLKRSAAIKVIDQRHFENLESDEISTAKSTEISNLGY